MGELFEADVEAALQDRQVVTRRLARAHETVIRHQHRSGEVGLQVTLEQSARGLVGEVAACRERANGLALFQQADLQGQLEIPARGQQHFGQLQLAGVEIEPAQAVGHDVARQDANRHLVTLPQSLGKALPQVLARQADFVGKLLCRLVEIGEMVAPAFDLAPRELFAGRRPIAGCLAGRVEQPGECHCRLRRGREPFDDVLPVDGKIGETRVGEAAAHAVDTPDRLVLRQGAGVEIEFVDEAEDRSRGQRPPVAFDEVEVAGRYAEPLGHGSLGQPFALAQAAQGRAGKDGGLAHSFVNILTVLQRYCHD